MIVTVVNSLLPVTYQHYAVTAEDSFRDALTTPKGSSPLAPFYGTYMYLLKHRVMNAEWVIDFRRCLKDACAFDPRLEFDKAVVDDSQISLGRAVYDVYLKDGNIIKGSVNV